MDGWLWAVIAVFSSGAITVFSLLRQRWPVDTNWPPGPRKLPIIGNLHQLNSGGGELLHRKLAKLADQYGGLITVWFGGSTPTIIVSDSEPAWEVLVTKSADFSSRTISLSWEVLVTNSAGLSSSTDPYITVASAKIDDSYWHTLRNGLQSTTLSPNSIFEQIPFQEKDVNSMLSSLQTEAGCNNGVVKPLFHLRRNTIRLIARFCFGSQFDGNKLVDGIDKAIDEVIALSGFSGLAQVIRFVRYIPYLNRPILETYEVKHRIEELLRPYISSHKSTGNCYLEFLLSQNLPEKIIILNLFEVFLFAVDSVSSTTAWALALLIHNPHVQQKLYEEVSREVRNGNDPVKVENVKSLPYLNAVVKETMRVKPIAPLAVPHRAEKDSTIAGTKIFAGTPVVVNLYSLFHDPKVWVEPHRYMPERFLDSSGISNEMERSFLPFGAGRRTCAGMELAKLQVAFTVASLVHKFKWSSVVANQLPDMSEDLTVVLGMKTPLAARITVRS